MERPYTVEVYFAALAEYNAAWFPASVVGTVLVLVAVALALRPPAGREAAGDRLIGAVLAAAWVWVGAIHQLQHMATLNFLAPVYGAAWILQGALLAVTCAVAGRVRFRYAGDPRGWAGMVIALYGLVGYPLIVLLLGYGWQALPLAGTAPHPTAIVTAGLLVMARDRPPLHLFVVPVAWAAVAAISARMLGFPLDYTVAAAIALAVALAIPARFRLHGVSR